MPKGAISEERAKCRINQGRHLLMFKRKVHSLRMITLGDYSQLDDDVSPQIDTEAPEGQKRQDLDYLYKVVVTDFEEGTTNKMAQAVRTLVQQTAFRFPEIDAENLEPEEQAVTSNYLKIILGPKPRGCNAIHHMRMGLLDYILGGMGAILCTVRDGRPIVIALDTLDLVWDVDAKTLPDSKWVAVRVREPMWYWLQLFTKQELNKAKIMDRFAAKIAAKDTTWLEEVVELFFYWDTDDVTGTFAVFLATEKGVDGKAIELTDNPHYHTVDGFRQAYLPVEFNYFLQFPSSRFPISIAEMMLPQQMASRENEKYHRDLVKRGAPWYDVEEGTYDEETMDEFEDGEPGAVHVRKKGSSPPVAMPGFDVPAGVVAWTEKIDHELTAQSGADPYASGNRVEGIQYAAEVNAIQGNSGLVAGALASDNSACWARVCQKSIWNGILYDSTPYSFTYEGVTLTFGMDDPISGYLRADAEIVVVEDSMMFEPKERRLARDQLLLKTAMEVNGVIPIPNSVKVLYERFLRSAGIRNVAEHFTLPTPVPGNPSPEGTVPGEPQATGAPGQGGQQEQPGQGVEEAALASTQA